MLTYEAFELFNCSNLVVSQLQCRDVCVGSQVSQITAFDLIIGEFDLKKEKHTNETPSYFSVLKLTRVRVSNVGKLSSACRRQMFRLIVSSYTNVSKYVLSSAVSLSIDVSSRIKLSNYAAPTDLINLSSLTASSG